jgi:hypothetical protein
LEKNGFEKPVGEVAAEKRRKENVGEQNVKEEENDV